MLRDEFRIECGVPAFSHEYSDCAHEKDGGVFPRNRPEGERESL